MTTFTRNILFSSLVLSSPFHDPIVAKNLQDLNGKKMSEPYLVVCQSISKEGNEANDFALTLNKLTGKQEYNEIFGEKVGNSVIVAGTKLNDFKNSCSYTISSLYPDSKPTLIQYYAVPSADAYKPSSERKSKFFIKDNDDKTFTLKKVVMFGDSLSDNGNFSQMFGSYYPKAPYWKGRFTNGPVWIEHFSIANRFELENWAYALAETKDRQSFDFVRAWGSSSLIKSVQNYLGKTSDLTAQKPNSANETLYFIWIGGNNYIFNSTAGKISHALEENFENAKALEQMKKYVNSSVDDIKSSLDSLIKRGAKKIVVLKLPDLGDLPIAIFKDDGMKTKRNAKVLSLFTTEHNNRLTIVLDKLKSENSKVDILLMDVENHIKEVIESPQTYGFNNTRQPCYKGQFTGMTNPKELCTQSLGFLFWDEVHPTTQTHALIGWFVSKRLSQLGWIRNPMSFEDALKYSQIRYQ